MLIEHLRRYLKAAVGRRHPSNLRDLKEFAKEERSKIPVKRWLMVIGSGWSQLSFPKCVQPNIEFRVPNNVVRPIFCEMTQKKVSAFVN